MPRVPPSTFPPPLNNASSQPIKDNEDTREKMSLGSLKTYFFCKVMSSASSDAVSEISKLPSEEVFQWSQSFQKLLSSKYGLAVFRAFLKSEFSDENIQFWLACESYKKIKSSKKLSKMAMNMFKEFIEPDSLKQINIDHQTRESISKLMQESPRSCFDEAQKIVYSLMERDSYPRFLRSQIYQDLLTTTQT
ncbi:regulator of G-protein signaling 13-like [Latimeria chalumnae]|uniref:regulator of G-protein signaling 13-like n=1 Tax=Latimeria chalumnae TaxID=7897 RepID=UPI0006D8F9E1|nr:PREDICTED: regulator of G-protein signaling 13-like [Latimeria chalumnae]|eukprot:XP_014352860.1 PREDICTED: regulator of G-protein signaling 13-like [Latimeria chalumnae]